MEDDLKRTPINQALLRPTLLFGADRELMLATGLICVILIFLFPTVVAALLAVSLWSLSVVLLRKMAKADPLMRSVFLRYLSYRNEYRALPTAFKKAVKYGRD